MRSNGNEASYISDDSDDLDLQTISRRISNQPTTTTSASSAAPAPSAKSDVNSNEFKINEDDDDPDWVKEFSVPKDEKEPKKRARTSMYGNDYEDADDDDDNDSIIDLLSDKEEIQPQRQLSTSSQQGKGKEEEKLLTDEIHLSSKSSKKQKTESDSNLKQGTSNAIKSSLPLVVNNKLEDSLTLLQGCTDGDELDLSGDVGTVGRIKVADDGAVFVDMKGSVFRAQGYKCNTMAVVSVGEEDAKINGVIDEAVLLRCERNLFESDQVLKGDIGVDDEAVEVEDVGEDNIFKASSNVDGGVETETGRSGARGVGAGRTRGKGGGSKAGRGRGRGRGSSTTPKSGRSKK